MKAVGDQKQCSRCRRALSISEFYVHRSHSDGLTSQCKKCILDGMREKRSQISERHRRYYQANADNIREKRRRYHQANAEKENAAARQRARLWREEHRAAHDENCARWRAQNPQKVRRINREYYKRNKKVINERNTAWGRANPDKRYEFKQTRRAKESGASVEKIEYQHIYSRDKDICYLCGRKVKKSDRHLDHVIPLSRGGAHTEENLRVTHARCNLRKGTKLVEELEPGLFD